MTSELNDPGISAPPDAGWYGDGDNDGWLRYWDGLRWTERRKPIPTPAVPAGWYINQSQTGVVRYWDGARWTDQKEEAHASTDQPEMPTTVGPAATPEDQVTVPIRFCSPPGWGQPSREWMAKWAGIDVIPPVNGPKDAPPAPPGWTYWERNEPGWTQWELRLRAQFTRRVWINLGIIVVGVVLSMVSFASAAPGGTYFLMTGAMLFGTIYAIVNGVRAARLTSDPWSFIRKQLSD